jgi:16S rRNA G1207 methylase RsmC
MAGPGDHYFSATPGAASKPRRVALRLGGVEGDITLGTDAGVFSATGIDLGTQFLLDGGARPGPDPATLVDVGCGYGPIAIALARRAPAATVWAVDVNERALELTRTNAAAAGVGDRVRVATPAEAPGDLVVDGIWSNPPVRVGKAALHGLLLEWLPRLAPEGAAHLVVARNLGADSLHRWLAERGHPVSRRGSRCGYRLLDVGPSTDVTSSTDADPTTGGDDPTG